MNTQVVIEVTVTDLEDLEESWPGLLRQLEGVLEDTGPFTLTVTQDVSGDDEECG